MASTIKAEDEFNHGICGSSVKARTLILAGSRDVVATGPTWHLGGVSECEFAWDIGPLLRDPW